MEKFLKNQQIPLTQVIDPNTGQEYYSPQNVVYQDKNNTGATYLKDVIVDQAVTASYFSGSVSNAVSASYALTASYVLGLPTSSISSSYALSASYAATASLAPLYLPLTGGTISGNVTVLGTASINTLIVNQIGYSSGSNQLGDAANDTQTLYGTVRIPTGSLTVSGSVTVSSTNGVGGLIISHDGSDTYFTTTGTNNSFRFSKSLRPSGTVSLGTYNSRWNGVYSTYFLPQYGTPSSPVYAFDDGLGNTVSTGMFGGAGFLGFSVTGSEAMRFASTRNVLIGTTTDAGYKLDVAGTGRFTGNLTVSTGGVGTNTFNGNINYLFANQNNVYGIVDLQNAAGQSELLKATATYSYSSGTAAQYILSLRPTYNFTSTYSGIVRGLYYNPTLTSMVGVTHRAIETTSGDIIFGGNTRASITGSLSITSSAGTGSAIYAYKSGSTVLDIQGSQGQLFSIIDALSGSLMSVNDVSGLPILEVFSDDRVVMGTYGAPALTVTGSTLIATGSLLGTASYATTALSASYAPSTPAFPYTGSALITGSLGITGSLTVSGSSTFTNIGPAIFSGSITQTASTASFGGLVGIGTTTPAYPLDINGSTRIYNLGGTSANSFTFGVSSGLPAMLYNNGSYMLRATTDASELYLQATNYMVMKNNSSEIGIRPTYAYTLNPFSVNVGYAVTPSAQLHVKGTGTTSATTAFLLQNANASASLQVYDDRTVYFPAGNLSYGALSGSPLKLNITQPTGTATYAGVNIGHLNTAITSNVTVVGGRNTMNDSGHFIFGHQNNISAASKAHIFGTSNTQNTNNGDHIIIGSSNTSNAYTNGQNASIIIGQSNSTNGFWGGGLFGSGINYYANAQLAFGGNSNNVNFALSEIYFGNGVRNENFSGNSNNGHGPNISINTSQAYSGSSALDRNGGNITLRGGQGTGTGSAGDVIFTTAVTGSTGATYHSYTNRVWIKGHTGNVGIGISTPSASLHISGASSNVLLEIDSPAVNNILYVSGSGNVGIGTGNPTKTLDVVGTSLSNLLIRNGSTNMISNETSGIASSDFRFRIWSNNNTQTLDLYGSGDYDHQSRHLFRTNGAERMRIFSTGNVTINSSTDAGYKLDVTGTIRSTGTNGLILSDGTYAAKTWMNGYIYTIEKEGSYGISTYQLKYNDTTDALYLSSTSIRGDASYGVVMSRSVYAPHNGAFGFLTYGTTTQYSAIKALYTDNNSSGLAFNYKTGGTDTEAMRITSAGNVGIGTTSPSYLLDVNGTARVTTLIETSAAKYKTNIQPLDSQLSKVTQLEPVTFDWINKPNPKTNIGLIADEVEKIYPEFVSKTEDGEIEGIEYSKLTTVLIQSIKELKEIVDKQQEQINTLLNK